MQVMGVIDNVIFLKEEVHLNSDVNLVLYDFKCPNFVTLINQPFCL